MADIKTRIASYILRHSKAVLVVGGLLAILGVVFGATIKTDNSIDSFFDDTKENNRQFKAWKKQFGSSKYIVVAFRDENVFTTENVELVGRLTDRLKAMKDIERVVSLTTLNDMTGSENDLVVEPLVKTMPRSPEELKRLRHRVMGNPLFVANIVSTDEKTTAILSEIKDFTGEEAYRERKLVVEVEKLAEEMIPSSKRAYVVGGPVEVHHYISFLDEDMARFLPLVLVCICVLLALTYRRFWPPVLIVLIIVMTLGLTMAIAKLIGWKVNTVTSIIPPILLAVSVAEAIHLVTDVVKHCAGSKDEILLKSMTHLFAPCFFTFLTTAVGFASTGVSNIPAIQQFGVLSTVGVTIGFILTFTLLPVMLKHIPGAMRCGEETAEDILTRKSEEFFVRLAKFVYARRIAILVVVVVSSAVMAIGIPRIVAESDIMEQIGKKKKIYVDFRAYERDMGGLSFFSISIKGDKEDYFKDPDVVKRMARLQDFVNGITNISKALSIVDFIKDMNKSFHNEDQKFYEIPPTRNEIAQYVLLYGAEDIEQYIDSNWKWASINIRMAGLSSAVQEDVIKKIRAHIATDDVLKDRAIVLGDMVRTAEGANDVVRSQMWSLSLASLAVFVQMFIVFRRVSVSLITIPPNLFPLIINFGLMGFCGIRLDTATALIAAIAVGIIVDNTIHLLHTMGQERAKGCDAETALINTFKIKGMPVILSPAILICAFSMLMVSNFVPIVDFGLLSAVLMLVALLGDVFLTPVLAVVFNVRFAKSRMGDEP